MELRELLEIGPGLTALIGGKTTLMYHLASELRQQGTVLVCSTTKIWPRRRSSSRSVPSSVQTLRCAGGHILVVLHTSTVPCCRSSDAR